ncbi:MAG: hypothetical protein AD742_08045 [Methylibium sp. NZG]|nr:MAG: hypothetical protein AD742_08045 [Methylibium sp. NZG]
MSIASDPRRTALARACWLAGLLAGLLASAAGAAAQAPDAERGRRLFHGELPLTAKIAGHTSALPAQASRCVNCHAAGSAPPPSPSAGASSASTSSFGPALDARLLLQDARRRGGPPSRYDEAALCKLLTTGIDPAYIIIPASMPRYELSPADCKALWIFLTRPAR